MTLLELQDYATRLKRLASKPRKDDPQWKEELKFTLDSLCIAWGTHNQPKKEDSHDQRNQGRS